MPNSNKTPLNHAIEIRNLNFFYGTFKGLKDVNLNIAENKVTAFIGPSGCGKSTLLRTLNRMYSLYPGQRAEGEINLYGKNILDKNQDELIKTIEWEGNNGLQMMWGFYIKYPSEEDINKANDEAGNKVNDGMRKEDELN